MNYKHGYSNHHLYHIWQDIKKRCYNKNCCIYKYYGGRGIQICDEWLDSKIFIEWALPLWKKGLEIDRRDNDGDYEPGNCRFITRIKNQHNRRLLQENNTSGYCGVSSGNGDKWKSYINIDGRRKHLGYFNTPEQAALAYDAAIVDERPRNFK